MTQSTSDSRPVPDSSASVHLSDEVTQLRAALVSRPEIEQAKGALMALHGCDADEAFAVLVTESQRKNEKLYAVARELLDRLRQT